MKKLIPIGLLFLISTIGYSQNLLNLSSDKIQTLKKEQGAFYEGKKYTTDGNTFIQFSYDLPTRDINNILVEAYYMNKNNMCDSYRIVYMSQKSLDYVVSQINSYGKFTKVPDKFMWLNSDENYRVEINLNQKGFEMICANGLSH